MNKGTGRGKGWGSPEMGCGAQGVPSTPQGLSLPGWDAHRCQDHRCAAHTGTPAWVPLHPGRCRGARPGTSPMDPLASPWDALWSRQLLVPKAHTTAMHRAARSRKPPTKDQGRGYLSRSRCFQALVCSMLSRALQNGPWRKRSSPRPGEPPGPAASPLLGLVAATSLSTNKVLPTSNALRPLCPPCLSITIF